MPKRTDIKSILIIGAGPIVIGQHVSLTTQVRKHVKHFVKKATVLFW
jgi:hypothetical protein